MAKPSYDKAVRELLTARVLDGGESLTRLVKELNRGELEPFPPTPVAYSTAYRWIQTARRHRDSAAPLDGPGIDDFTRRLWSVALAELRKLERDSRKPKPLDVKRLNDLEAAAAKLRRYVDARDKPDPQEDESEETAKPSLLTQLAAQHSTAPEPAEQSDPRDLSATETTQPAVAREAKPPEHGMSEAAGRDRVLTAAAAVEATQPSVA